MRPASKAVLLPYNFANTIVKKIKAPELIIKLKISIRVSNPGSAGDNNIPSPM